MFIKLSGFFERYNLKKFWCDQVKLTYDELMKNDSSGRILDKIQVFSRLTPHSPRRN